ncbi:MAG: hypothetical protein K8R45_03565 [Desulfobacterales bacterium]|nr:hypothetical protein [Desulfobacterales bacterium]
MASQRDRAKVLRASRRSRTLSGGNKAKTAVDVAVVYVEDVLGLTTQPSEFAADSSRNLFSDSLLGWVVVREAVLKAKSKRLG